MGLLKPTVNLAALLGRRAARKPPLPVDAAHFHSLMAAVCNSIANSHSAHTHQLPRAYFGARHFTTTRSGGVPPPHCPADRQAAALSERTPEQQTAGRTAACPVQNLADIQLRRASRLADARAVEARLAESRLAAQRLAESRLADARLLDAQLAEARMAEAQRQADARLASEQG
eukprot:gnl/Hemi2/20845_TR6918_c0_g2_i1.p1 gnl/Hemi2/20845_TR6918_c0_g2~~gnl/Hemi2/20845_TR6918_c0_g2_i1.p1  ORF type:complete len:174 (-),score=14.60 gnl/Hemi2/20845_TR6918_c0_g2_i1:216-737(-)